MNNSMNSAMKAVGVSLAVGSAVAMVSYTYIYSRPNARRKKTAKKAVNTFSNLVDNMHAIMK